MLAKYIQEANTDYRRIQQRIPLGPLRTAADYNRAVTVLDEILDDPVRCHTVLVPAACLVRRTRRGSWREEHVPLLP